MQKHDRYFMRWLLLLVFFLSVKSVAAVQYSPSDATLTEVRAEQRSEADLQAQQDMVKYTAWAVGTAAASGAIGALTLLALWWSLRQAERALSQSRDAEKATRERDQASIRAYVHVDKVTLGSGGRPILHCKNTGATPAKFFAVGADIKRVPYGEISRSAVLGNYEMKAWPALGGSSELTVNVQPTRGEELLEEFVLRGGFAPRECLVIVGRVVYADIFDSKFETGFVFYTRSGQQSGSFSRPVNGLPAFRELSAAEWSAISEQPPEADAGMA
ncbi:hypothetical protein [Rhizobium sp. 21-4511-3d]